MKKLVYFITCCLVSSVTWSQSLDLNKDFSREVVPSFNNPSIRLDNRIFIGDYNSTEDFVDVLAISSDCTVYDPDKKIFAPMKGNISSVYLIQPSGLGNSSEDSIASVFASIDKNQKDAALSDGGGVIFFKIRRQKSGSWKVISDDVAPNDKDIYFKNVSFSKVGGTVNNQSFVYVGSANRTSHRLLVTEDVTKINSNKDLIGFSDTSDYTYSSQVTQATQIYSVIPRNTKVKRYKAMGYPVELDGNTGTVIGKVHRFGRGVTAITNSSNAFYIAYGGNPSILLKYTANESIDRTLKLDFPSGDPIYGGDGTVSLLAYKQNADGTGDFTVKVALKIDSVNSRDPSNPGGKEAVFNLVLDSLMDPKQSALIGGATMFANIGDLAIIKDQNGNNVLLVTEKGIDDSGDMYNNPSKVYKGKLAHHLQSRDLLDGVADGKFSDPYGRILAVGESSSNGIVSTLTEGGQSNNGRFFSNPDKLEVINTARGSFSTLVIVKENVPSIIMGRNPAEITSFNNRVNEAYYYEANGDYAAIPEYNSKGQLIAMPIPFSDYSLFMSGSNGSNLSSNGGFQTSISGSFITNFQFNSTRSYDTYLTVVNGYKGTDKSMILAVRNNYPQNSILGMDFLNTDATNKLKPWPNPSRGVVNLHETGNYTLCNLGGIVILTENNTNVLDLSGVEKGVYIIRNDKGVAHKVVIY